MQSNRLLLLFSFCYSILSRQVLSKILYFCDMGSKSITIKLPTDYTDGVLHKKIAQELRLKIFSFRIENKSLDARQRNNIHWLIKVLVFSDEIKDSIVEEVTSLVIPYQKSNNQAVVVGSGPSGFFSALILLKAGYKVTIIERGHEVEQREKSINEFEQKGVFDPKNNYSFGEGGAGTFSDGKLTSRSKHISLEKKFILENYIKAGAPEEIAYLAHPHLGTDHLKKIVKNLRIQFLTAGGTILFDTLLEDISILNGRVTEIKTSRGIFATDVLFIAAGHSAYETYRMLISRGVPFRTKNFAIGSRMEHRQEIINHAQWGYKSIPGVKAAEYRLTSSGDGKHSVYSFCMCPGGIIVPAAAYANTNIVNGMSMYDRNGQYANAACVAGVHVDELAGKTLSPLDALLYVENLEQTFYNVANGYNAPICSIEAFINKKETKGNFKSSYPLSVFAAPIWEMLPKSVSSALRSGLVDFTNKMRGFEQGNLLGLESKTSSPIQVVRDENLLCKGFENLYIMGEGSGYAGGIISSAADGIKAAMAYVHSKI